VTVEVVTISRWNPRERKTAAVHGGKASKGRKASRGCAVTRAGSVRKDRTAGGIGGNVVNPTVGYALQHTRPDREEETGEVA
jgi:hypothetical protein